MFYVALSLELMENLAYLLLFHLPEQIASLQLKGLSKGAGKHVFKIKFSWVTKTYHSGKAFLDVL